MHEPNGVMTGLCEEVKREREGGGSNRAGNYIEVGTWANAKLRRKKSTGDYSMSRIGPKIAAPKTARLETLDSQFDRPFIKMRTGAFDPVRSIRLT